MVGNNQNHVLSWCKSVERWLISKFKGMLRTEVLVWIWQGSKRKVNCTLGVLVCGLGELEWDWCLSHDTNDRWWENNGSHNQTIASILMQWISMRTLQNWFCFPLIKFLQHVCFFSVIDWCNWSVWMLRCKHYSATLVQSCNAWFPVNLKILLSWWRKRCVVFEWIEYYTIPSWIDNKTCYGHRRQYNGFGSNGGSTRTIKDRSVKDTSDRHALPRQFDPLRFPRLTP